MSSNTNQTSATPNQQFMAALQALHGPTTSATTKEVYNSFVGREMPDKQSEEVSAVDNVDDNPPDKDKEELGQCSSFKNKGQKDSRCKQQATVRPYKGNKRNNHLVYCEDCWEIKREKNIKSCANRRLKKKTKVKQEKQNILEFVDKAKISGLSLMPKQFEVMILRLAFISQLVSVRNAFHNKMQQVRKDTDWTSIKKAKANDGTATRIAKKNLKNLCHYRTFGTRRNWQTELEGLLSAQTVFLLTTLFQDVKNILPNKECLTIETLRLVVTDTPGWETPHFVENYNNKVEDRWGWTFHLSLCEEGTHLSLWGGDNKMIQKVHIPFGCALLTRSDVCHAGLGYSPGNMMLQGNLFAEPMFNSNRDLPHYTMEPTAWASMTDNIVTQDFPLIGDETLANEVAKTATMLRNFYTFSTDFLDCMKTK